jgi:hypothetical protein
MIIDNNLYDYYEKIQAISSDLRKTIGYKLINKTRRKAGFILRFI